MMIQLNDALFLSAEEQSFENDQGNTVEFTRINFLDDDNNHVVATIDSKHVSKIKEYPYPRTPFTGTLEIQELTGSRGKYLKKKLIDSNFTT